MFLTSRLRDARKRGDHGAVAVVVALVSLLLFSTAALAVDIGVMYNRRRSAQLDADFAALAGSVMLPGNQTGARQLAYEYLAENLPPGGAIGDIVNYSDGVMSNGEIYFPTANKIRVVVPRREVKFGLAAAMGFSSATVTAAATVEVRSPASTLPFFLTVDASSGYSCLKDTSGGQANSPVRAALLMQAPKPPTITTFSPATVSTAGGETLTVDGTNFKTATSVKIDGTEVSVWSSNNPGNRITLTTPAHVAGNATLVVTNPDGFASTAITYVAPPPTPAPTVTALDPPSGPTTGGTAVTITGTNLTGATSVMFDTVPATAFTVTDATTMEATSPPGTGAVHVTVTTTGGTSPQSNADLFTYEVDACAGVTGSFGYLDIPRDTDPDPPGENDRIMVNIAAGIDHGWTSFPNLQDDDPDNDGIAIDQECKSGNTLVPGAILDDGDGVDGANCLDVASGNKVNNIAQAFLDGYNAQGQGDDLDPKLKAPSGHTSVTLPSANGRSGMDGDHIEEYLTVDLATFVNNLTNNPDPDPDDVNGWLDASIAECPRFAIVPVIHVSENPQNGYYPIKTFAGVFLDGPAPNYGFEPNNNGTQIQSIRAYAFDLDYLPGVLSAGTTAGTVTYLGTGPKVPVLVHDDGDPSY